MSITAIDLDRLPAKKIVARDGLVGVADRKLALGCRGLAVRFLHPFLQNSLHSVERLPHPPNGQ